jgi:hypothetical protein
VDDVTEAYEKPKSRISLGRISLAGDSAFLVKALSKAPPNVKID